MRSSATNSPENLPLKESGNGSPLPARLGAGPWLDETCVLDMDNFVKMLADVRARGTRPDLVGSVISHCAIRWLPELSSCEANGAATAEGTGRAEAKTEGSVAAWMKKRFFVETLVGILPPEKDALPCGFLLRLLRVANMVGAEPARSAELEARVAKQLDQASLRELMIPAFSHTCGTLLDVGLVLRLVRGFAGMDEAVKSGAATVKVAKLVDAYLAEAAVDANLTLPEFEALAGALPGHARATDDGLYRAVDTYLKAHPSTTKEQRKALCRLIDTRKLSSEASFHAVQNERLPLRAVIQVLFSEHTKLNRLADWSGPFSGPRSPTAAALELPARCPSKREVLAQQQEIRKLRDDVARLQIQCHSLQAQIDRLVDRKNKGFFKWRSLFFKQIDVQVEKREEEVVVVGRQTPMQSKKARTVQGRSTPTPKPTPKWRNSLS